MRTLRHGVFMSTIRHGVDGGWDSAIIVLISTMQSGLTRLVTGDLTVTLGHRLDGTIPGAHTTLVDRGIPEADMIHGEHEILEADMIHGEDQDLETRCMCRNVVITSMRIRKETSTGTLIKVGSSTRRMAGQRHPVRHRSLIATRSLDSKVIPRRKSAVRVKNAVVAAEAGRDAKFAGGPAPISGVWESWNR
jgi:hypothetical protein